MRLFTAILFDDEIKESLYRTICELKSETVSGSFTVKDNLHLTLNFIGETKRVDEVKQAMGKAVDKLCAKAFSLSIRGLGRFKRREGDIYWAGVEKNDSLVRLQRELVKELKAADFPDIDDTEYTPHLTLGRRVKVGENFSIKQFEAGIHPMQMEVRKISLMKSERLEGKLVYTEIYSVELMTD